MSGSLIPVVDLLVDKKSGIREAHLVLFEYCNLKCSFCHQNHKSKVGMDTILEKVETLIRNTDPKEPYTVNMTGGELFMDEIPDEMFEVYYEAGKRIFEHFDDVLLVLGTNLVYERYYRLLHLVRRLKELGWVKLATSYDPAGRFNAADKERFFTNLEIMQEYVGTVNVVITRQNIDVFLKQQEGDDFIGLYRDHKLYFDHYIPSDRFEEHQPSEEQIKELYLILNERYPEAEPLKSWKKNQFNELTCRSTKIVNKDGVVTTCWSEAGREPILDEAKGLIAKSVAEEAFLNKYQCHACVYYKRCGLRCFLHHQNLEDKSDVCQIKLMFQAIIP